MDRTPVNRGVSLECGAALPHPRSGSDLRQHCRASNACHGHSGQAYSAGLALAEWLCRTADRIDPARVPRQYRRLGRGAPAPDPANLCPLLQQDQNTPIIGQRCTNLAVSSADRKHHVTRAPRGPASPICPSLSFRYTQAQLPVRAVADHASMATTTF